MENSRIKMISGFYSGSDEDSRLIKTRQGQLEYFTTMHYIHRFINKDSKILEVGAGTGRYSVTLAKEGYDVTAVELVKSNLEILQKKSKHLKNIQSFEGDALDLSRFSDNTFDLTLVLGPLYHLYEKTDINKAIDEAIRVTKRDGIIIVAFISVYAILHANFLYGNWDQGLELNFTEDYQVKHFEEQLFTGYDIIEFEELFKNKNTEWVTTAGVDGPLEAVERRSDFELTDSDFKKMAKWYLTIAEKRELLGLTNHLIYICRKNNHLLK